MNIIYVIQTLPWAFRTVVFPLLLALVPSLSSAAQPPKLVLQITVDALRGDLPQRYSHLYGKGGFAYLMERGVYYSNAHYQHANTETIVGHTSLATGTVPAAHGMVGNVWFDREQGRLAYNIEDANYQLLGRRDATAEPGHEHVQVDERWHLVSAAPASSSARRRRT